MLYEVPTLIKSGSEVLISRPMIVDAPDPMEAQQIVKRYAYARSDVDRFLFIRTWAPHPAAPGAVAELSVADAPRLPKAERQMQHELRFQRIQQRINRERQQQQGG